MIARKSILWSNGTNAIVLGISLIILFLHFFGIFPAWTFFIAAGMVLLMIFMGVFNSAFALDEQSFLQSYDNIKQMEADAKAANETIFQYIRVIGEHEAVKLWNATTNTNTGEKIQSAISSVGIAAKPIVDRFENAIKSEINRVEEAIKTDASKVETAVKEVFEEKAANNIISPSNPPIPNP